MNSAEREALCKKFAELEGVETEKFNRKDFLTGEISTSLVYSFGHNDFNPITDLALNCAARDKYEVEVCYLVGLVAIPILDGDGLYYKDVDKSALFESKEDIPRAVIECILKHNGVIYE